MKKVCHITIAHNRNDVRILQRECFTLQDTGYDVTFLVNDDKPDEVINGVKIISVHSPLGSKIKRLKAIRALANKAVIIDADIYHLHEPDLLFFSDRLRKHGKKVIFDSHEAYSLEFRVRGIKSEKIQRYARKLYRSFEKRKCRKLDATIIPGSCRIGNDLQWTPFKGINDKTVFIANYPKKISFNYYTEKKDFKVCYAGILSYERGITNLIHACYKAGVPLILAGKFSTKDYERQVINDPAYSIADYRGLCEREEVYKIYQESSLGAAVLLDYGQNAKLNVLPTKVYEYFQCKLPVLFNSYPYAEELNEKYQFGISVDPNSVEQMAAVITKFKEAPELCQRMGENGYSLYKDKFTWEKEAQKLADLYAELC